MTIFIKYSDIFPVFVRQDLNIQNSSQFISDKLNTYDITLVYKHWNDQEKINIVLQGTYKKQKQKQNLALSLQSTKVPQMLTS